jgi:TolB-like protein/Flp pilus assembly protein TadD
VLAIGFVPALIFSWAFEITPEGLKREHEVAPHESITESTGRKLDFAIIGVLAIAVALLLANQFVFHRAGGSDTSLSDKSIAVLPFANTSGDAANEYFSDGMSEELINELGRLQDLTVIGRSSSFQFKGNSQDAKSIGAKLGVAYLLEGSVRKAANKVRIAVELVNASNGASIWSETYDRDLNDIFAVQSEIALQVAHQLQSTLLGQAADGKTANLKPDAPPSGNVMAYNALLQGNFYFEHRTAEDLQRAIDFYKQATALDPNYGAAYSKLAYARADVMASFTPNSAPGRAALEAEVRSSLEKALEIDPDDVTAIIAEGYVMEVLEYNMAGAISRYRRAVALAPQNSVAGLRLGEAQANLGQYEAAIAVFRRLITVDPLSARTYYYMSLSLSRLGRYDDAEAALRKAMELQPQTAQLHSFLALVQIQKGQLPQAIASAKGETDPFWRNWALTLAYEANGDHAQADAGLQKLIAEDADDGGSQIAIIYAFRKQPDEMFRWLDHAYDTHDAGVQQIRILSFLAPYEQDPRFEAIARKVGVMPATDKATP